jgi:hypothetical protein
MNRRGFKPSSKSALTNCLPLLGSVLSFAIFVTGAARAEQTLSRQVPEAVTRLNLQPATRLPASTPLNLAISLSWRNQGTLTNLLQELYNPASPGFHHYLTPEQFAQQFGPTTADYEAVIAFAQSNGLTVTGRHPNRMLVDVSGPASKVEQALKVRLFTYHHPTEARDFYAPGAEPSLDLTVPVLHVSGLDNFALPHPLVRTETNFPNGDAMADMGSATNGSYMGDDFRAAYIPDVSLTGTGQTVGLLEFDGYYASDIAEYESQAGLPGITLSNVLLDGFNGIPVNYDAVIEVSLDIEMAISMAPGLSQVIVYEAGPNGIWHDILNRMADDDLAGQLSCSWFSPGGPADPVADQIFQQMAAQGQSMFAASGDRNAYNGLINFPDDDPYITLVGGTMLTTSGPDGEWMSETVWNTNLAGSSGGISTSYSIPSWQQGVNMSGNQGSTTMRNVPDVALTAYNVYVVADQGVEIIVAGTSCASPLWAGFTALVNQQAAASYLPPIGFLNPAIYMIGLGTNYDACFHDIVIGNNTNANSHGKFLAEPGYDLCTGWGSPAGQSLINALTATSQPGPPSITTQPQSQMVAYNSKVVFFVEATGTFPLLFQWSWNGTNIASATNVTLLLTNVQVAQSGTYAVLVSNSSGVLLSSNAILTVEPPVGPSFTAQPVSQTVAVGGTAIFSAGADGTLPLNYQWTLNGTNLPGATNDSLTLGNVQISQAGIYAVQVSNVVDAITSSNAALALFPGWTATSAPSNSWSSIASSADGTKLAASIAGGLIYTSSNSGATWIQSGAPSANWNCIASSSDGAKLVAAVGEGPIYTSTNSGTAWKKTTAPTNAWVSVASSTNGVDLAALKKESGQNGFGQLGSDPIYTSINSGTAWQGFSIADFSCPKSWAAVASSANGQTLVAVVDGGPIFTSVNSGTNWTKTTAPSNAWSSVACSADGSNLVAAAHTGNPLCNGFEGSTIYNGPIYTSTDSGATWTEASAPSNNWMSVASSADGTKLVVAARNGPIYLSTDSGATWSNSGAPTNEWTSVASSADGNTLVATGGQIYIWQRTLTLGLTVSGGNLLFSWPAYWNGAVLLQNSNLTTTNWVAVTNSPVMTNGEIQVTVSPSGGNYFYQLSYP